jgi:hypothetical protein
MIADTVAVLLQRMQECAKLCPASHPDLAARDLWPKDEAAVTALDFAQLALLRLLWLLWLQRETRRAVRTRQREAAALLARTSMGRRASSACACTTPTPPFPRAG